MITNTEKICAFLMYILTYFFTVNIFELNKGGFSITLFTLMIICLTLWYFKMKGVKVNKNHKIYLVYLILVSLSFSIFENYSINFFTYNMLFVSMGYWLITLSGNRTNDLIDEFILKDLWEKIVVIPLKNFNLFLKSIFHFEKSTSNVFSRIILGMFISIPILIFISSLLMVTDITFNKIINKLIYFDFSSILNIPYFIFSLILASGMFSALYTNINKLSLDKHKKIINFDDIVLKTILISLVCLYSVYLLSILYTYLNYDINIKTASEISSYARKGFFELSVVSFINFIVFSIVKHIDKNEKYLLSIIGFQTLIITIMGLLRMFVYVGVYGLTSSRFNTLIFMGLMVFVILFHIFSLYINYNYMKISVLLVSLSFLFINFIYIDKQIVNYNIINNKFDFEYIYNFEVIDEYIKKYYETVDNGEKNKIMYELRFYKERLDSRDLINMNLEILYYKNVLNKFLSKNLH
ncbi:MAG: DUF4173 domain-containing protein [Erysipelotrichaceae bacterium]|nr:DUF4173 domain-containing protein [Erysipelotrichaceae bacterium]